MMTIEDARASLESYLKEHRKKIEATTIAANSLKKDWLKLHPECEVYDLDLDIVWDGPHGGHSYYSFCYQYPCLDGCCPGSPTPRAKGLHVEVRDWDVEAKINEGMKKYFPEPKDTPVGIKDWPTTAELNKAILDHTQREYYKQFRGKIRSLDAEWDKL